MYCGDDVSSVVFDIGSYQVRSGYSGEDVPRSVLPSMVGVEPSNGQQDVEMESGGIIANDKARRTGIVVGQTELGLRRDNMDVQSIFDQDGILKFDYLDEIIDRSLVQTLNVNISETPILFSENAIHNKEMRMKLTEYMFEKYKIPALFIVKDPVLAAFSCGRSSALILDSGHKSTIATPVHDGYALLKCIIKHDIGGQQLTKDLNAYLLNKKGISVKPRFTFKKKFVNVEGAEMVQLIDLSANEEIRNTHPNYMEFSKLEIVREMKEDFCSIADETLQ